MFTKTGKTPSRSEAEVTMFDNVVVVYRVVNDLIFLVTGDQDENEIIVSSVLNGFYDSIHHLLRGQVDKRTVLENLDLVLLVMDETVEQGLIVETDPMEIASRVTMREASAESPLGDQAVQQAISTFKEYARQFLR